MTKLYKAKNFRRDYECTSIKFRRTDGPVDSAHWEPATESELRTSGAQECFTERANGFETTAYGWL